MPYLDNLFKAINNYGGYLGNLFSGNFSDLNFDDMSGLDIFGALFGQDPNNFGLNRSSSPTNSAQGVFTDQTSPILGNSASSPGHISPVGQSASASDDWNQLFDTLFASYKAMVDEDRAYNEEQTQKAWERTMDASNTAHQREVADLLAAGLNPWLSVQGGGASSPSSPVSGSSLSSTGSINSATSLLGTLANVNLMSQSNDRAWLSLISSLLGKLIR